MEDGPEAFVDAPEHFEGDGESASQLRLRQRSSPREAESPAASARENQEPHPVVQRWVTPIRARMLAFVEWAKTEDWEMHYQRIKRKVQRNGDAIMATVTVVLIVALLCTVTAVYWHFHDPGDADVSLARQSLRHASDIRTLSARSGAVEAFRKTGFVANVVVFPHQMLDMKRFYSADQVDSVVGLPCRTVGLDEIHTGRVRVFPKGDPRDSYVPLDSLVYTQQQVLRRIVRPGTVDPVAIAPKAWRWEGDGESVESLLLKGSEAPAFNPCVLTILFPSGSYMTMVNPTPAKFRAVACGDDLGEPREFLESYTGEYDLFNYWRGRRVMRYDSFGVLYDSHEDGDIRMVCMENDMAGLVQFWIEVLAAEESFRLAMLRGETDAVAPTMNLRTIDVSEDAGPAQRVTVRQSAIASGVRGVEMKVT